MSSVLHLDPVGGIAGDMFLAAAIDLGVPLEALEHALSGLALPGWRIEAKKAERHAIVGTQVTVHVEEQRQDGRTAHEGEHAHSHVDAADHSHVHASHSDTGHAHRHDADHDHTHAEHSHGGARHAHAAEHSHDASHDHDPSDGHEHRHPERPHAPHRPLSEIVTMIERCSTLSPSARSRALSVFQLLGQAEAKVHNVPVEQVEFHEVGAVDSIIDICGAAAVLELLGNPAVFCGPLPMGSGTTRGAHGVIPIPAPATLEVLRGSPVRFEGKGELTTPTGAAIVRALAQIGPPPELTVDRIGYGVGTKDWPDRPNVLRAIQGEPAHGFAEGTFVLEANLDDTTPQLLGALLESLLAAGALDVSLLPATMKKSRPGHLLSVVAAANQRDALIERILRESTTLGVRFHRTERVALERKWENVSTRFGDVRIKLGMRSGHVLNFAPEFEDCRARASEHGVPVKDVWLEALARGQALR